MDMLKKLELLFLGYFDVDVENYWIRGHIE